MIIMTIPHVFTSMPAQLSFPPGTYQSNTMIFASLEKTMLDVRQC